MSDADKWKQEAVKVLEDMKHRPSSDVRERAVALLGRLTLAKQADRRAAELRKAIARYDRNLARR